MSFVREFQQAGARARKRALALVEESIKTPTTGVMDLWSLTLRILFLKKPLEIN